MGILKVPGGAFELPLLASKIIRKYSPKLCLVVGCIIKGETQHYEFLSSTVIMQLEMFHSKMILQY